MRAPGGVAQSGVAQGGRILSAYSSAGSGQGWGAP